MLALSLEQFEALYDAHARRTASLQLQHITALNVALSGLFGGSSSTASEYIQVLQRLATPDPSATASATASSPYTSKAAPGSSPDNAIPL